MQDAITRVAPRLPAFFGRPGSRNNAIFRKWGLKRRTNEEMRADYQLRAEAPVADRMGLVRPAAM